MLLAIIPHSRLNFSGSYGDLEGMESLSELDAVILGLVALCRWRAVSLLLVKTRRSMVVLSVSGQWNDSIASPLTSWLDLESNASDANLNVRAVKVEAAAIAEESSGILAAMFLVFRNLYDCSRRTACTHDCHDVSRSTAFRTWHNAGLGCHAIGCTSPCRPGRNPSLSLSESLGGLSGWFSHGSSVLDSIICFHPSVRISSLSLGNGLPCFQVQFGASFLQYSRSGCRLFGLPN